MMERFWKPLNEDVLDYWSLVHFFGGVLIGLSLKYVLGCWADYCILAGVFMAGFIWETGDAFLGGKLHFFDGAGASLSDIMMTTLGGSVCLNLLH